MPIRPQRHSLLAQSDSQSPTTTPSSNLIGLSGLTPPQSLEFESPTNLAASPREQRSNQQYDGVTGERIGESVVIIEPDTRDESHRYDPVTGFPFLRPRTSIVPIQISSRRNPSVNVGFRVRKISIVSETTMSFFCRFTLFMDWNDPDTRNLPPNTYVGIQCVGEGACAEARDEYRDKTGDLAFCPLLRFFGASDLSFLNDTPLRPRTIDDKGNMKLVVSGSATFDQEFELRKFPFDVQALRIIVRLQNESDGCSLHRIPMSLDGRTSVVFDEYYIQSEFATLRPFIDFSYHGKTEYGQQAPPKSELTVVVPLKRAYGSYVNHVGLVTFMITTATFTSFCVDLDSLADRMSIVLTLFLTIVATKFLVQERLPRVAFMTYLDVYFTGCFTFFVLVILSSVVSSLTQSPDFDRLSSFVTALLWVLFNLVCLWKSERVLRAADGKHISKAWIPHGMTQRDAMLNVRSGGGGLLWTFKC